VDASCKQEDAIVKDERRNQEMIGNESNELIEKTTRSARMLQATINGIKARLTEENGSDATDAEAAAEVLDYGRMWIWIVERLESQVGPKTEDQIVRIVEIVQHVDELDEVRKDMSESEKERNRDTLHRL
jgi:hypothetical protein